LDTTTCPARFSYSAAVDNDRYAPGSSDRRIPAGLRPVRHGPRGAPAARLAGRTVLWPEHDPLFPREWSDRIGEFFSAAELTWLDGAGHFSPLEAPAEFAAAVTR
jgi:pimeloyl-ACP methyl ester carboxylesterase